MSFQKKFEEILIKNNFDLLAPYTNPIEWDQMNDEERELLGILFVKQGEQQLKNGDVKVLESFQLASQVAPDSPHVYFRQALVYASQEMNIRCLIAASEALEKATDLDPLFVKAWHAWGNILAQIGVFYHDSSYFHQADEKFKQVEKICLREGYHHSDNFYWHWGICWFYHGKHSGEAVDYFCALSKFQQAMNAGFESGEFYNDYGNILIELSFLIGRKELFSEAVNFYKRSVKLSPERYEGWLNLACTYDRLYDLYGSGEHFRLADESFEKAATLNLDSLHVWLRWGEHYANSGKTHQNMEHLRLSFEKFEKAHAIEPDNSYVLLRWGEAQMLWASQMDNFDQLQGAKNKIAKSLDTSPENPDAWYVYGNCLIEFGSYFEDEEYYLQAIEKFQYGLSLNQSHSLLWYGLALAYFAIGELRSDFFMIEKSIQLCTRVIEFGGPVSSEFWNHWGVALMKLGEMAYEKKYVEAALDKFEQAIISHGESSGYNSNDLECLYNYGCAWDFLGELTGDASFYEKAIQVLSYVLQHDPTYNNSRYNLALALSHLGELNADIDCFHKSSGLFQELLREDPEDELVWNDWGEILLNLAFLSRDPHHIEYSQKLYEQAENKFLHAIALGYEQAFYNLACLYSLIGNYSASMHYLERAQISHALPSIEDVLHDEWLEGLRNTPVFRHFISYLASQQEKEKL
jgi:tetratricopeptide (TPR) repeat protein